MQIMSVLEAHVALEKAEDLASTYQSAGPKLPPQMVRTYLLRSVDDPTLWRGTSIWRSREALEEYRRSVETPGGVLIFRSVGAEPTFSLFEIVAELETGG